MSFQYNCEVNGPFNVKTMMNDLYVFVAIKSSQICSKKNKQHTYIRLILKVNCNTNSIIFSGCQCLNF